MTADRTRLTLLQLAVLLGVCGFLFFFGIGAFGLVGADEPRYAQIAREMFQRHDWIVPTLNGKPWLEKPVLLYWMAITCYRRFGVHDWAARLPAGFLATALVLVIFFFMRRFRRGGELDAAIITASSAAVIGFARGASTDMLLAAPFGMAMLAWWAWRQTEKKLWLAAFYALLAVGALAKGPVAPALALLIVTAYAVLRREGSILLRSLWWPGFVIFFAVTLPWFVAIQMNVPEFFRVFFIEHNLERFGTNLYQHSQPFWYYIPVFLLSVVPWIVFTLPALVEAGQTAAGRFRRQKEEDEEVEGSSANPSENASGEGRDGLEVFLLLWIVVPILFFSISRSKLPGYILPAIPAAAVLTADYLHRRRVISRTQLMLHSLLCGAVVLVALAFPLLSTVQFSLHCGFWCKLSLLMQVVPDAAKSWIIVTAGVAATFVLIVVRKGGLRLLHFATLIPMVLILGFLLRPPAAPVIDQAVSARSVNDQLLRLGHTETPVAVFDVRRDVAYGLNFYRNHPVGYYSVGPYDLPQGVPSGEHVVITKAGNVDVVRIAVGDRNVTLLGKYDPQHLGFFLVSGAK